MEKDKSKKNTSYIMGIWPIRFYPVTLNYRTMRKVNMTRTLLAVHRNAILNIWNLPKVNKRIIMPSFLRRILSGIVPEDIICRAL